MSEAFDFKKIQITILLHYEYPDNKSLILTTAENLSSLLQFLIQQNLQVCDFSHRSNQFLSSPNCGVVGAL